MRLIVTLDPPDVTGAWRLHLTNPPPNLPTAVFVRLDDRPYPFQAPPPTLPTHPINLLWRGASGQSQPILDAVRAVAAGELSPAQAEALIAERLLRWSQQWARVQGHLADQRSSRGGVQ